MEPDLTDLQIDRLWAHLQATDTRWFRAADWLMEFGRHGVPEHRDSRNPIRWAAAELALRMTDAQTWWINRRHPARR